MGEVYRAHDSKLDRPVALKRLAMTGPADPDRLRRLRVEALAASSLNHPHIVVIHDLGDLDGSPFIISELVEGETLRERLRRGPAAPREALDIAIQIASALAAAHGKGIVHRDIKPENVMIRTDGYVKVVDFGLAKLAVPPTSETMAATQCGLVVGTPHYMSPEQARGLDVDARADVWGLGIVIHEMLSGRPPFDGATAADVIASVLRSDLPPLDASLSTRSPSLQGLIQRALARDAVERFASAHEMHAALIAARHEIESVSRMAAGPAPDLARQRIIVLPLRILKPDPETDFLAFSLPDAVSASLAKLESLIVRSSLAAQPLTTDSDVAGIARHKGVELIVAGTIVRSGDRVRIAMQLLDASGGVTWSHAADITMGDLFRLQDSIVDGIVQSLSLPLTRTDRGQLRRDVPASARAYEHYLRANDLSQQPNKWRVARELYVQAVDEDPQFAPAWAQLARMHRMLGKNQHDDPVANLARAEEALGRALRLNPDLSTAHRLSAQLEVDRGYAEEAMVRLLMRARDRADTELFAALVPVCRVCGLMEASIAADARARALDSGVDTGVMHTFWLLNRYEDAIAAGHVKAYVVPASLVELGRLDEASTLLADLERQSGNRVPELAAAISAFMAGRHDDGVEALIAVTRTASMPDPELLFYVGRHLAHVGEPQLALPFMQRAFEAGHFCYPVLANDPWLDALRAEPAFEALLDAARMRWRHASAMFAAAGGPTLLGMSERSV